MVLEERTSFGFELLSIIKISLSEIIFFSLFCCWSFSKSTQLVIRYNRTGFRLALKVQQEKAPNKIFSLHNNASFRALMIINTSGFRIFPRYCTVGVEVKMNFTPTRTSEFETIRMRQRFYTNSLEVESSPASDVRRRFDKRNE